MESPYIVAYIQTFSGISAWEELLFGSSNCVVGIWVRTQS
jgi:hypothetical protein